MNKAKLVDANWQPARGLAHRSDHCSLFIAHWSAVHCSLLIDHCL